ncbi:aminopeptidase [Catellicoccus marimammalium]|uniref:Aminopeptidase S n=1 Tax=Catellicoccus marimammalium M35/04/3 TaxID=1234409 RepID=K8ZMB5_9ENTE|nr:aminopeptidase [Catellicoccus marimammalium]EKU27678.1 Aminopeptidase S [Catellicoccus marimammalium M35/04/3]
MENFEHYLEKYAELIIKTGINVSENHTVIIQIAVDQAPLARLLTKEAYKQGAKEVIVKWKDDAIQKEFLQNAAEECLENIPTYVVDEADSWIERGASRISVVSSAPDALEGVPADRLATWQKATNTALFNSRKATQSNQVSWTVVAAAGKEWAAAVFPDLPEEKQVDALWNEIFKDTRIYDEDPIAAWEAHDNKLASKANELNEIQYDALHYTAPGTDLTIGLPKDHVWKGAGSFNSRGEEFMANMPTEEVFTAPDFRRVDGYVTSTKPLSYAGNLIEDFTITFENGRIVDVKAKKGEEVLKHLIDTDEGSHYLGEVALVPDPSPISQSNIIFFNTLFDENASNHLAIGAAYAFNVEGGTEMSEEELKEAGLNRSATHVDFMIGSDKMNIDGIRKDGTCDPIFRNGDWA